MTRGHAKSRLNFRRAVPPVWLMTDERVGEGDLVRAIARLPRGSAIVLRHYSLSTGARRALFSRVRRAARRRGAFVLLAGDAHLARTWGADGHHGRSPRGAVATPWLHSTPVHNMAELGQAERAGADVLLLSPLFATRSHPGERPLGPARFASLARAAKVPVIALGGVRPRHAALVRRLGAAGFAAIDGLTRA
ncbi:MAG: thiamine phosphate synthase [Sphingobium sp.]|nr:thiamine phosphate synthase [Sphingobium sp.]